MNLPSLSLTSPRLRQALGLALILVPLLLPLATSCAEPAAPGKRMTVFVGIAPHLYLGRRIGGSRVRVEVLLPPGKSPASFVPNPDQTREMGRARLYFYLGLPFERELVVRLKKQPRHPEIVNLQEGLELRPMSPGHKPREEGGKTGLDPHTWLDPRLAARQAATMARALSRSDPAGRQYYTANLARLQRELHELYLKLQGELAPLRGATLLVYHPAFGYFARAFGLKQMAIETGGKRPKGRTLAELIHQARRHRVKAIFVEPQFDRRNAEKIAASLDCEVVQIDPLAGDYSANLNRIAETIRRFLGQP